MIKDKNIALEEILMKDSHPENKDHKNNIDFNFYKREIYNYDKNPNYKNIEQISSSQNQSNNTSTPIPPSGNLNFPGLGNLQTPANGNQNIPIPGLGNLQTTPSGNGQMPTSGSQPMPTSGSQPMPPNTTQPIPVPGLGNLQVPMNGNPYNNNERRQLHVHEIQGSVEISGNEPHSHRFASISSEEIPYNNSHYHEVTLKTDYFKNHFHEFNGNTTTAINIGDNHIHYLDSVTTTNDGHNHNFKFITLFDDPTNN